MSIFLRMCLSKIASSSVDFLRCALIPFLHVVFNQDKSNQTKIWESLIKISLHTRTQIRVASRFECRVSHARVASDANVDVSEHSALSLHILHVLPFRNCGACEFSHSNDVFARMFLTFSRTDRSIDGIS